MRLILSRCQLSQSWEPVTPCDAVCGKGHFKVMKKARLATAWLTAWRSRAQPGRRTKRLRFGASDVASHRTVAHRCHIGSETKNDRNRRSQAIRPLVLGLVFLTGHRNETWERCETMTMWTASHEESTT